VRHEAEAEGLAAALFKDDPRTNPFFVMVPRQLFAHLLIEQPKRTPQELLAIMRDERELASAREQVVSPQLGIIAVGRTAQIQNIPGGNRDNDRGVL
jgi:hypothetical protein